MKYFLITISAILLLTSSCFRKDKGGVKSDDEVNRYTTEKEIDTLQSDEFIQTPGDAIISQADPKKHDYESQTVIRTEGVGRLSKSSIYEIAATHGFDQIESSGTQIELGLPAIESFTSLNRYFMIHFENDIFAERDQYYTNGIAFTWIHPYFRQLPITRNLPGLGRQSVNHYGVHLRQMMFTPIHPETDVIVQDDRPFAGVLYLGFFRISVLKDKGLNLRSEIQLGAIGPSSLAETLQRGIHEKEPNGWVFQVQNDLLINFNLNLEKTVYSSPKFDAGLVAGIKAGSLHTNASGGVYARYGSFGPYFRQAGTTTSMHIDPQHHHAIQYWFFGRASNNLVWHDATLNGGLFNKNSPHTFSRHQMNRQVFEAEMGGVFVYKQYGLQFGYTYLSPEFTGGREHFWGSIKLFYIY
jgi:lipid A 3-O-deacylase